MATVLASFWLWGVVDRYVAGQTVKKYQGFAIPADPSYTSEDVSMVVPTIDSPETFATSLTLWMKNNPLEIIIVTTEQDLVRVVDLINQASAASNQDLLKTGKIKMHTVPKASKRKQLAHGIMLAEGSIIALTDDDTFWGGELLEHLLAPFEDPRIGGTGGYQGAYIPFERRNNGDINAWEVAALYTMDKRNKVQLGTFAADGGCTSLAGRTALYRASILKDPAFLYAFTNDYWLGRYLLDSGDDVFTTRWLDRSGWELGFQATPAAEIESCVANTSKFIRQMIRWERNTIRSNLRNSWRPSIWRNHPSLGRKLLERLLRPVITWIHIWAWIQAFRTQPIIALAFALYYIWSSASGIARFARRFPYCGKYLWVLPLMDNSHIVQDLYCWSTLNETNWMTRKVKKS